MERPEIQTFELTKEECEAVVKHFKDSDHCLVFWGFPEASKFKRNCQFCDTLFVGYDHATQVCPCHVYGKYFVTNALITLLDDNDFEIPGDPEDYEAIREFI